MNDPASEAISLALGWIVLLSLPVIFLLQVMSGFSSLSRNRSDIHVLSLFNMNLSELRSTPIEDNKSSWGCLAHGE